MIGKIASLAFVGLVGILVITGCSKNNSTTSSNTKYYDVQIVSTSMSPEAGIIEPGESLTMTINTLPETGGSVYYKFSSSGGTIDKSSLTGTTEAKIIFSSSTMGTFIISYEVYGVDPQSGTNGLGSTGSKTVVVIPWQLTEIPFQGLFPGTIDGISEKDFWIIRNDFTAHYNGTTWDKVFDGIYGCYGIKMSSSNAGKALGSGQIFKYDGNTWEAEYTDYSTLAYPFTSLEIIDAYNIPYTWVTQSNGNVLHYNGSGWTVTKTTATDGLTSVSSPFLLTDIWAVGWKGKILHSSGGSWTEVASPTTNDLRCIKMLSATDGWAIGEKGTILHYDGSSWQVVNSPTTEDLYEMDYDAPNNIWAIGYHVLLHYDGIKWSQIADFEETDISLDAIKLFGNNKGKILAYSSESGGLRENYMFSYVP